MSYWNYRIVRKKYGDNYTYSMHEVYYDDNGTVTAMANRTELDYIAYSEEGEDEQTLVAVLTRMLECAKKHEVLDDPWPVDSTDKDGECFTEEVEMCTLTVDLDTDVIRQLEELSKVSGISTDHIIRAGLIQMMVNRAAAVIRNKGTFNESNEDADTEENVAQPE